MSFLTQAPSKTMDEYDTEIKPLTAKCNLYLHDCEADGVVTDIQNEEAHAMHVRFNFEESENLSLNVNDGVTQVDEHRCGFDIGPGEFKRVIHLDVVDIDLGSYDLKYKVEGFVRKANGELVDAKGNKVTDTVAEAAGSSGDGDGGGGSAGGGAAAAPVSVPAAAAPGAGSASGSATMGRGGAGGGAAGGVAGGGAGDGDDESPFGDESEAEVEMKRVNDDLQLKLLHFEEQGYEFRVVVRAGAPAYIVNLDCSDSENLTCSVTGAAESTGEGKLTVRVPGGQGEHTCCRLTMTDPEEEGYGMAYKINTRKDTSTSGGSASGEATIGRRQPEPAAPDNSRQEAEDRAKRIREENDARAAAEEEARKQREEEAAARKAEEDARKAEDAAARAGREAEERERRAAERAEREAAAAAKKESEAAKRKAAEEERNAQRQAMMDRARAQAEAQQRAEEDRRAAVAAEEERKAAKAAEFEAREGELYGEMNARRLTPFEQREVEGAERECDQDAERFANDCAQANPGLVGVNLKPEYVKTWKMYAFIKRRFEIEWRLRHLLIQKMFGERICALCRDYMPQSAEVRQYKTHRMHPPCYDAAPKCDQCSEILVGDYVTTRGDNPTRLHNECVQAYKNRSRPTCGRCNQRIMDDRWTTVNGEHFHTACP